MRRLAGVCAIVLLGGTGACSSCSGGTQPQVDAGVTVNGLPPEQAAKVLARVGDRTITLGDYVAALEHMDPFDRMRYQSSPERRKELLQEMIDVMVLADEAREKGYDNDPIAQQEVREILRDAMLKRAHAGMPGPNEIADDEVRMYFDSHKADFHDPERRRLSLIVVADARTAAAVLAQAKKTSGAAQWGELVRTKSIDPQAKANVPGDLAGDAGFVAPPGDAKGANPRVPEPVRAAAFEIAKVGDVLDRAVESDGRFYLVRLASKTDAHDRTLQEAERAIRVRLSQDKMRAKDQALLDELRKQFPVQVDEAALAQVRVETAAQDAGGE